MPENITAEIVFDKHAVANALPARNDDESLDAYVARASGGRKECTRRLALAVDAARVGDHTECALWCSQARPELPEDK